jgi:hypothetical protein
MKEIRIRQVHSPSPRRDPFETSQMGPGIVGAALLDGQKYQVLVGGCQEGVSGNRDPEHRSRAVQRNAQQWTPVKQFVRIQQRGVRVLRIASDHFSVHCQPLGARRCNARFEERPIHFAELRSLLVVQGLQVYSRRLDQPPADLAEAPCRHGEARFQQDGLLVSCFGREPVVPQKCPLTLDEGDQRLRL